MQKHAGKMAIITRTRNRTKLLERALQSVASQTSKEYIHVVLNDGGDKADLERLLEKYPDRNRVVIHNDKTRGHTRALNQAIRAVESTYISILDDDDSWAPERVATVNEFMDEHHSNGAVVVMDRIVEEIGPNGNIRELSRNRWLEGIRHISLYKQCLDNYLSNGSFNYTRKVYGELEGYDETLDVAEDWDFGIRYLLRYDADFIDTGKPLAFYHHRPEQKGDAGNSVFAGVDEHSRDLNLLRNRYLRKDIAGGKLGVGYIMNELAYTRERDANMERKDLENVVRIEGHVNYIAEHSVNEVKEEAIRNRVTRLIKDALRKND